MTHDPLCPYCFPARTYSDSVDRFANTLLRRKLPEVDPRDMRVCEKEAYDNLPDKFIVYRGYATFQRVALDKLLLARSWTTSEWVAGKFIRDHTEHLKRRAPYLKGVTIKTILYEREITKSMVLAVCLRRNEFELILKSLSDVSE